MRRNSRPILCQDSVFVVGPEVSSLPQQIPTQPHPLPGGTPSGPTERVRWNNLEFWFSVIMWSFFFFLHHTFCFKNPFVIIVVSLSSYYQQLFRFNSKFYSYHWSVTYTLHLLFLEFLLPTFFFHLVEVFHEYDFFSEMAHFCTLYFPLFPPTGKTSFLAGVSCSSVLCHVLF